MKSTFGALVLCVLVIQVLSNNDLIAKFKQSDYSIRNCRTEVERMNKKYMKVASMKTFKYNRTTTAFNVTFGAKMDMGTKIEVLTQMYKRASNEYRLFPIHFQLNFCKIFNQNLAGLQQVKKSGNMTTCEWKKDIVYHTYNFAIDDKQFPPLIPTGEYKAQVTMFYGDIELVLLNLYGEVYRVIRY